MELACGSCGEAEALTGTRRGELISITCEKCGHSWERDPSPSCGRCEGRDLEAVPLAIVEKGRGTQLSIVGTRTIHLCTTCDADTLLAYHRNRPNPLMPDELPN